MEIIEAAIFMTKMAIRVAVELQLPFAWVETIAQIDCGENPFITIGDTEGDTEGDIEGA